MNPVENPSATSDVQYCVRHPKAETRLCCGVCEAPICTRCVVYCEVGIKCPKCVTGYKSHALKAAPRDLGLAAGLSLLAGQAWAFLFFMGLAGLPMILVGILSYVAGAWVGGVVHRACRYKLSGLVYALALGGCVLGLLLGVEQHASLRFLMAFPWQAISLLVFAIGYQNAFRAR